MTWTIESDKRDNGRLTATILLPNDTRITVLNSHIHYPDHWILNCYSLNISQHVIAKASESLEAVQKKAIEFVKKQVDNILQDLQTLI
jgi:hypothetical protein